MHHAPTDPAGCRPIRAARLLACPIAMILLGLATPAAGSSGPQTGQPAMVPELPGPPSPRSAGAAVRPSAPAVSNGVAHIHPAAPATGAQAATMQRPTIGLLTSLPLYWGEAETLTERLGGAVALPPVRAIIERGYTLVPLDLLATSAGTADPLAALDRLILAQPRALSGAENVALDAWVRAGGRLLVFADPLLTGDSRFPLGDRRRPIAVALLGPILAHWGLDLGWRPGEGARVVQAGGLAVPVEEAGHWSAVALASDAAAGAHCTIDASGLIARCRIGAGQALLLADAAVLDSGDLVLADAALTGLLTQAFDSP